MQPSRISASAAAFITFAALAAPASSEPVAAPFGSGAWSIEAREAEVVEYLGRRSLRLVDGSAELSGVELLDGVVEFDIAFPTLRRGFAGLAFRIVGESGFEHVYLRPHQSGQVDANQYTPVFHGVSGWQLYHGEGYGAPTEYAAGVWVPVRIVIAGDRAEVFIGDGERPAIAVRELLRPRAAGGLALTVQLADARISNFRYDAEARPKLVGTPPAPREDPAGTVREWLVSSTVPEASVEADDALHGGLVDGLEWTPMTAEPGGVVNLARLQGISPPANTAFARFRLAADAPTVARVRFGYSDRVAVFVDGRRAYSGSNDYRSRDFRYLGTIGLFDQIPVEIGDDPVEVWFAVSESFGGWGIAATVAGEGVRVEPIAP